MEDHHARPSGTPGIEGLGLRMAIPVAVVTICAAALLLVVGGWQPELCSALRATYPLCAL